MARLTYRERQRLPSSAFVYPRTRRYPIEDIRHGRNAIARAHQFGSPGTIRTVERTVHREYPSIEIERHNPDLVGDFLGLALVVGGGVLAFGWLKAGGFQSLVQALTPSGDGKGGGGPQVASPTPKATTAPTANSGSNSFNFNDSTVSLSPIDGATGTVTASAGFGHIGPGGTFVSSIVIRDPGGLGGPGDWQTAYGPTAIVVGNDPDWTGYSIGPVSFDVSSVTGLGTGVRGIDVQFLIDGGSGERYTQTAVHNTR